jgi:hypothetical protein
MNKYLKIVKDWQPLIIGLLILWLFLQKSSHDSFIEDRDREFKRYSDSLNTINKNLFIDNVLANERIDSAMSANDSLSKKVISLDSSIVKMNDDHEEESINIRNLGTDGTIKLLSVNLSSEAGN